MINTFLIIIPLTDKMLTVVSPILLLSTFMAIEALTTITNIMVNSMFDIAVSRIFQALDVLIFTFILKFSLLVGRIVLALDFAYVVDSNFQFSLVFLRAE